MATRDGDGDAATTFTPATLRALVERSNGALCAFACDGVVFDATLGKDFYGVGGPYAALNGRDTTRALATMKINVSDADEALGARGLTEEELKTLGEWRAKFESKYPRLGTFERRGEGN